jgi:uncharacterized membrane protein
MLKRFGLMLWEATRRYFVAGLLALAPVGITVWAIIWIIQRLDNLMLPRVLEWVSPGTGNAPDMPPLVGALFTFVVILLSGVIVRHLFGHEVLRFGERLLARVPIAGSIYGGVKQLFVASLATGTSSSSFNRVVLVEYPRKGIYALAFITGETRGPISDSLGGVELLNCFVPTTPNPTSGFYLVLPANAVIEVDLDVEDAFKVIMSAGMVMPGAPDALLPGAESEADASTKA